MFFCFDLFCCCLFCFISLLSFRPVSIWSFRVPFLYLIFNNLLCYSPQLQDVAAEGTDGLLSDFSQNNTALQNS